MRSRAAGNDRIVARLGGALSEQIETDVELTTHRRNADGSYTPTIRRGSVRTDQDCSHVVLAIPSLMPRNRVDWSDGGRRQADRDSGARDGGEIQAERPVQPRHRNELGCNGEIRPISGISRAGRSRAPGRTAAASWSRLRAAVFPDRIEPVLPGIRATWNGKAQRQDWADFSWTLGSYSHYRVGEHTLFGGAEGEHTSLGFQGYLQGAVVSGERAGGEILGDSKSA